MLMRGNFSIKNGTIIIGYPGPLISHIFGAGGEKKPCIKLCAYNKYLAVSPPVISVGEKVIIYIIKVKRNVENNR